MTGSTEDKVDSGGRAIKRVTLTEIAATTAALLLAFAADAADTIRIAHIDPMSEPFGLVGESLGRHLDAAADAINARGGVLGGIKFEITHFDNKSSPQEILLLAECSLEGEWEGQVRYLPLR